MTGYLWCLHCERAFVDPDPRPNAPMIGCQYDDCDGSFFDLFGWEWPKECNSSYPAEPEPGVVYPLYGVPA